MTDNELQDHPADQGLIRFYASEAEAVLSQYRRVDDLLGPGSNDHTHTGNLCESLLREFLQRIVLQWIGVDKGFIYGRTQDGRHTVCSPEVDILLHNQRDYRPIFRSGELVIVQPEAVMGILQVKKNLVTSKRNPLAAGLENVIEAKRHLLQQLSWFSGPTGMHQGCVHVYSAVIGFGGKTKTETYHKWLQKVLSEASTLSTPVSNFGIPEKVFLIPHFVGSIAGHFCVRMQYDERGAEMSYLRSVQAGHNIALQVLAEGITTLLWEHQFGRRVRTPFQYPELEDAVSMRLDL